MAITQTSERLLRKPAVLDMTGMGATLLHEMVREGRFPRPIKLSARAVAWPESAVQAWIADRVKEGRR
ncbi:AlpA family phage regulatory protein [Methylococcus sp. ANG]|uniref:helix-turn-helix transcriptional regulator n=1 Tax=Methylococcus sp. ANG TaxID=3231903 RepID=UPI0034599874